MPFPLVAILKKIAQWHHCAKIGNAALVHCLASFILVFFFHFFCVALIHLIALGTRNVIVAITVVIRQVSILTNRTPILLYPKLINFAFSSFFSSSMIKSKTIFQSLANNRRPIVFQQTPTEENETEYEHCEGRLK